jgi:hypothetical protein
VAGERAMPHAELRVELGDLLARGRV